MYLPVVDVKPEENSFLRLEFSDGQKRILDMKPFLDFGVFNRLKDQKEFNRVHISFDTIEWDCGVDLDPEFVLKKSESLDIK